MAGRRARSAVATGAELRPTRVESSAARRVQRFEAEVEAAGSPVELVTVSAESVRSIIKHAKSDIAGVVAEEFVNLCRRAMHAITSGNTEIHVNGAATDGNQP